MTLDWPMLQPGASLAYQLTRPGAAGHGKTVVLVEAKDVASGASACSRLPGIRPSVR
jgi:glycine/D-amino acid oxidase-like deaminating enzyme